MNEGGAGKKSIVIVAGEASGDQHGANLVRAMLKKDSSLSFHGVGGPAMRGCGVHTEVDSAALAVVGITEVFSKLPVVLAALRTVKKVMQRLKPSLLILIDFPEFNLKTAAAARRFGIPVLYYISPQIWAWRPGRVKRIGKCVDHMAVILPFEEQFYRRHRIEATFVGHPLLDNPGLPDGRAQKRRKAGHSGPVVGLLPGSRAIEIRRHLPVLLKAAAILRKRNPDMQFKLSRAAGLDKALFNRVLNQSMTPQGLLPDEGPIEKLLTDCDLAVAVSGTVTLQTALFGVPMIIIYRVSALSYWIGRALIRVPFIGLVNLVAGRQLAPELIQKEVSAARIADEVEKMLADPQALAAMRRRLTGLRDRLGGGGASVRVADIALSMLK